MYFRNAAIAIAIASLSYLSSASVIITGGNLTTSASHGVASASKDETVTAPTATLNTAVNAADGDVSTHSGYDFGGSAGGGSHIRVTANETATSATSPLTDYANSDGIIHFSVTDFPTSYLFSGFTYNTHGAPFILMDLALTNDLAPDFIFRNMQESVGALDESLPVGYKYGNLGGDKLIGDIGGVLGVGDYTLKYRLDMQAFLGLNGMASWIELDLGSDFGMPPVVPVDIGGTPSNTDPVVPEPGTLALFGFGLVGCIGLSAARRRKA